MRGRRAPERGIVTAPTGETGRIRWLIPDLPSAAELSPYLQRIDAMRWYTNFGPLVRDFEARLGTLVGAGNGVVHCVTTSSGTAALELALAALDLPRGARVLVPSFTFPASATSVARAGLQAVLCDVCPHRWQLTPEIARRLASRHRFHAVMPVAGFGAPLDVGAWDEFSGDTGLPVLVDAAAALGVVTIGRRIHLAYSLHATKPLGIGEGGVFATRDAGMAGRVRRATNFGFADDVVRAPGTNAKLSEYAAAVGLAQLDRWQGLRARRMRVLNAYRTELTGVAVGFPPALAECAPAVLVLRLPRSAATIARALDARGVETRRVYVPPLHRHPAFRRLARAGAPRGRLPVCEELSRELLGVPFHTFLDVSDVAAVAGALRAAVLPQPRRAAAPAAAPRAQRI